MTFSEIPGLEFVKERLTRTARSGMIPHAQLFQGSEGTLNLPLALAYATYLHCESKSETDACGVCPACSKSRKFVHPDTNFVFPAGNVKGEKDEERLKADLLKSWRSFLTESPFGNLNDWVNFYGGEDKTVSISREESREIIKSLSLKPFESRYKVMIIWQPEYMHPSAANGILKILEEPPPNTIFLLVSNHAEQLLPTIVSRTQSVQVPLLADEEMNGFLTTLAPQESQRQKIVQLAEGDINLAMTLLEAEENQNQEVFTDWMRACFKKDYIKLVGLAETFHELDKLSQRNLLRYSASMMRESILQLAGASTISRVKGGELKFVQDFSNVMTIDKIDKVSTWMNESEYYLERNGSAKMIFLDLSLQIANIIKA